MRYTLPVNLLIADDHQMIIDGLTEILQSEKGIAAVYSARNGREAVRIALREPVDCIIMDINMPELNGLEASLEIKKEKPEIKIIVVSMLCEPSVVTKLLRAGADAFINKEGGKAELLTALQKVMGGEHYLSPGIADGLFRCLKPDKLPGNGGRQELTKRELEIIRLIADGLTDSEIAAKLFLSSVTVSTHRKNMLAKLQLKNTATLVKYAADHQLL